MTNKKANKEVKPLGIDDRLPCTMCGDLPKFEAVLEMLVSENDLIGYSVDGVKYTCSCAKCSYRVDEYKSLSEAISAWNKLQKSRSKKAAPEKKVNLCTEEGMCGSYFLSQKTCTFYKKKKGDKSTCSCVHFVSKRIDGQPSCSCKSANNDAKWSASIKKARSGGKCEKKS